MDILINVVGTFVVEVGKFVCKCIYPKIENTVRFSSNKITKLRDDIKGKTEKAEGEGYKPKPDVIQWIEDVSIQENTATAKTRKYKCCPNCSLRSEVCTQVQNIRDQLCSLKEVGENFGFNLMVENYQVKKVEFLPGPSIEGQSAATRNLNKILQHLEDDKVCIIGVFGTGGVGKTTLVKNLNNEILKTDMSSSKLSFGVVVWVTVPKPLIDIKKVQAQIVSRLNLKVDKEESVESIASKIYQRHMQEESFLLILDDVWEAINLDHIGVPKLEHPARSKVIITSRSLDACKQMKTDTEMKVYTLDEDESWQLFVNNAGDFANIEQIQPFAKEIARECDGLPLAITLWEDALKSLRMSEPHNKDVKDKVYKVIKWSFGSLESQDIELSSEQRSKHVNKRRGDIRSCFLYCSLYPAAMSTNDLIHCWCAEGFLGEHDTYEEAYNRGITMIESLKDVSLLETDMFDSLKMHDVISDVAVWLAYSFGDEHNSVTQAGIGLTEISHTKVSASVKRISFVSNKIQCLPDNFTEYPETTTLLLQDNDRLWRIPNEFFLSFPALRVVNLSKTGIRALPCSINSFCQLRALILQNCNELKELPPIGNLSNLQLLDCDNTKLCCLLEGMDKLTNLRLLNLPVSIEMLKTDSEMMPDSYQYNLKMNYNVLIEILPGKEGVTVVEPTSFDEISSLHNLTSLFIRLDSSSIFNRDHTWMKRFHISVGNTTAQVRQNKSRRKISVSHCEIFSNGELSGMLQFASHLCLEKCMGLRKVIVNKKSFNGLKSIYIHKCSCYFTHWKKDVDNLILCQIWNISASSTDDPLPNLEYLYLHHVSNFKSVSDFDQLLGLRFSKLRKLDIHYCHNLTCLFNVGGPFSVPRDLKEISLSFCRRLRELLAQFGPSQTTLVSSQIPSVRKLCLVGLLSLKTFGEPWELEELEVNGCYGIRKLPLSIQTSNNIKIIKASPERWWNQLEWDDDKYKSNLEHCVIHNHKQKFCQLML
ncbi:hypothetical protein R3W88_022043 [Solanum pinnatisectum]|uniref:Disease resistance protein n=1 Tax=Solanum pinnatisectum TaxID=50273 RepID=A0AAV9LTI2_9SOLN|nr:hypothetical protein R3W88_022043 [Solanum pinnatisectum]